MTVRIVLPNLWFPLALVGLSIFGLGFGVGYLIFGL